MRCNDLIALPPALTDATALTRLALSGNPLSRLLYIHRLYSLYSMYRLYSLSRLYSLPRLLYIHRPSDATLLPLMMVLGTEKMISGLPQLVRLQLAGVGCLTADCLQGAVARMAAAREAGRRAAEAGEPPLPSG